MSGPRAWPMVSWACRGWPFGVRGSLSGGSTFPVGTGYPPGAGTAGSLFYPLVSGHEMSSLF